jgi:hypothetical protein
MCRSIKVAEPDVVSYGGLTTVTTYHLQRKDEHVVDSGEWPLTECLGEGACWEGACWDSTETHCPTLHVNRINSACAPPTPPQPPCAAFMHENYARGRDAAMVVTTNKVFMTGEESDEDE